MRNPSPSAPAGWNTSRHIQSSSHRKTARYEASGRAETLDRTDCSRSVPPPPVFLARRRAARRKKIGRPTRRVHVWNVRALPRRNRCSTAGARARHRRFPAAETSAVGPKGSGAAPGAPPVSAGHPRCRSRPPRDVGPGDVGPRPPRGREIRLRSRRPCRRPSSASSASRRPSSRTQRSPAVTRRPRARPRRGARG